MDWFQGFPDADACTLTLDSVSGPQPKIPRDKQACSWTSWILTGREGEHTVWGRVGDLSKRVLEKIYTENSYQSKPETTIPAKACLQGWLGFHLGIWTRGCSHHSLADKSGSLC